MNKNDISLDKKPAWLDPNNDRKTSYTEEELELFVEGFIAGMDDIEEWKKMVSEVGEKKAREILKEGFRRMDPNNPIEVKDIFA